MSKMKKSEWLIVVILVLAGLAFGGLYIRHQMNETQHQTQVKKEMSVAASTAKAAQQAAAEAKAQQEAAAAQQAAAEAAAAAAVDPAAVDPAAVDPAAVDPAAAPAVEPNGLIVAIDPGHMAMSVDPNDVEPNGPGSEEMKAKDTSGTVGSYTGLPEYQLNLDVSLRLRDALQAQGYQVVMTRETNDLTVSCMERAVIANDSGANAYIRIHANGSDDPASSGALALIPSPENVYNGTLYDPSNQLAACVLDAYCAKTGFGNLGVQTDDTMTGNNWSTVPVMILEMGFMTNESDDVQMADGNFQPVMVEGIVDGINAYFGR